MHFLAVKQFIASLLTHQAVYKFFCNDVPERPEDDEYTLNKKPCGMCQFVIRGNV